MDYDYIPYETDVPPYPLDEAGMSAETPALDTILNVLDRYNELLGEKERLAAETKDNNREVESCRNQLAQLMVDAEVPEIGRNGFIFRIKPTTKYSKKAGADDELFDLLRERGLGDIIKETVNAQTLQGTLSELAEENGDVLPEEFLGCVNIYEFTDISRRKNTKK